MVSKPRAGASLRPASRLLLPGLSGSGRSARARLPPGCPPASRTGAGRRLPWAASVPSRLFSPVSSWSSGCERVCSTPDCPSASPRDRRLLRSELDRLVLRCEGIMIAVVCRVAPRFGVNEPYVFAGNKWLKAARAPGFFARGARPAIMAWNAVLSRVGERFRKAETAQSALPAAHRHCQMAVKRVVTGRAAPISCCAAGHGRERAAWRSIFRAAHSS